MAIGSSVRCTSDQHILPPSLHGHKMATARLCSRNGKCSYNIWESNSISRAHRLEAELAGVLCGWCTHTNYHGVPPEVPNIHTNCELNEMYGIFNTHSSAQF